MTRIIRDEQGEPIPASHVIDADFCREVEENTRRMIQRLHGNPDPFGVADPTPEELREEAQAREDDRLADADWGFEPPC